MCGRSAALRSLEATQPGRHAVSSPGLRPNGSGKVDSANGRVVANGLDAESGPSRHGNWPDLHLLQSDLVAWLFGATETRSLPAEQWEAGV